jgi:hypothetical protein
MNSDGRGCVLLGRFGFFEGGVGASPRGLTGDWEIKT